MFEILLINKESEKTKKKLERVTISTFTLSTEYQSTFPYGVEIVQTSGVGLHGG